MRSAIRDAHSVSDGGFAQQVRTHLALALPGEGHVRLAQRREPTEGGAEQRVLAGELPEALAQLAGTFRSQPWG